MSPVCTKRVWQWLKIKKTRSCVSLRGSYWIRTKSIILLIFNQLQVRKLSRTPDRTPLHFKGYKTKCARAFTVQIYAGNAHKKDTKNTK